MCEAGSPSADGTAQHPFVFVSCWGISVWHEWSCACVDCFVGVGVDGGVPNSVVQRVSRAVRATPSGNSTMYGLRWRHPRVGQRFAVGRWSILCKMWKM